MMEELNFFLKLWSKQTSKDLKNGRSSGFHIHQSPKKGPFSKDRDLVPAQLLKKFHIMEAKSNDTPKGTNSMLGDNKYVLY